VKQQIKIPLSFLSELDEKTADKPSLESQTASLFSHILPGKLPGKKALNPNIAILGSKIFPPNPFQI
jgi:hypothetical protein